MTTESSADEKLAIEQTRLLRLPIALVLLLVNLFWLLISIERFLVPRDAVNQFDSPPDFAGRAAVSFGDFAGLASLLLPLVAVLLVTHFRPVPEAAKLVVGAALAEYAISALFGVVAFLGAFFVTGQTVRGAVEAGFTRLGWLALLGVSGLVVGKIAQVTFRGAPKPDRFAAYGRQSQPAYENQPAYEHQPFAQAQPPTQAPPHTRQPVSPPPLAPPHVVGPVSAPPQAQAPISAPPHLPPISAPPHPQRPVAASQPPQREVPREAPPLLDDDQRTQLLSPDARQQAEEARLRAIRERQQHWGQQQ